MSGIGDYLTSTLGVAEGDGTTAATYVAVLPDGSTASGNGTGGPTSFTAVIGPLTSAGWGLTTWTVTGAGAGVQRARWYVTPTPTAFGVWPPCLADLKLDAQLSQDDESKDAWLSTQLDAAIAYVRDRKGGSWDLGEEFSESGALQAPDASIILGTIRLALRWSTRPRSPDGVVNLQEQGSSRITSFDPDIDRMLRLGRYSPAVFA